MGSFLVSSAPPFPLFVACGVLELEFELGCAISIAKSSFYATARPPATEEGRLLANWYD